MQKQLVIYPLIGPELVGTLDEIVTNVLNQVGLNNYHTLLFLNQEELCYKIVYESDKFDWHINSSSNHSPENKTTTVWVRFKNGSRIIFINQDE